MPNISIGATVQINLKIDSELKKEAQDLYADLGLSLSTAITMFLKKSVMEDGIPFKVQRKEAANKDTLEAIQQIKNGEYKEFDTMEAFKNYLNNKKEH